MDLKSIAVGFDNLEQRKEIERKFEEAGFEIYKPSLSLKQNQGYLGVGTDDDIVYNLTRYKNKENIISYEEFIGGSKMKRLDIRKDYEDENLYLKHYNNPKYSWVAIRRDDNYVASIEIRIGNKYNTSITQANAILKSIGLNYELYESVGWSEVEVGAEVSISREYENGLRSWFTATFKEYIPQTNQIIVFNNNKVEVYDESEVELCN